MRALRPLAAFLLAVLATPVQAITPEQAMRLQGQAYCRADWQPIEASRALTMQQCLDEVLAGKCTAGSGGFWGDYTFRTTATGLEISWGDPMFWEPLTTRDRACRYPLWLDSPPSTGVTGCQVDPATGLLMHRDGRTRDFLCQGLNYVDRYGIYMGQVCRCAPGIKRGDYSLEQMQRLAVTNCASIR